MKYQVQFLICPPYPGSRRDFSIEGTIMSGVDTIREIIRDLGEYDSPDILPDVVEKMGPDVEIEVLSVDFVSERRWGYDEQTTLRVDGQLVGVLRYVVTGDGEPEGPDTWDVYPVNEVSTITYQKV